MTLAFRLQGCNLAADKDNHFKCHFQQMPLIFIRVGYSFKGRVENLKKVRIFPKIPVDPCLHRPVTSSHKVSKTWYCRIDYYIVFLCPRIRASQLQGQGGGKGRDWRRKKEIKYFSALPIWPSIENKGANPAAMKCHSHQRPFTWRNNRTTHMKVQRHEKQEHEKKSHENKLLDHFRTWKSITWSFFCMKPIYTMIGKIYMTLFLHETNWNCMSPRLFGLQTTFMKI